MQLFNYIPEKKIGGGFDWLIVLICRIINVIE